MPPLGGRYARITPGTPGFRISSSGWTGFASRDLKLITSGDRLYELVREKLNTKLPTFAVRLRQFVDRYLDNARARARAQFDNETPGLITPDDWFYSAFLPLPNARIALPPEAFDRPAFAELSVLFWTGDMAIGVQLDPAASVMGSKQRYLDWLTAHWPALTIVEVSRDQFGATGDNFPTGLFPDALTNFWADVSIPQGPGLSRNLDSPLAV